MLHTFLAPFLLVFSLLGGYPADLPQQIDHASASVVRITGTRPTPFSEHSNYVCSGFVLAPQRVITVAHCLGDSMRVDGKALTAVLAWDTFYDLALLDAPTAKPALRIRESPVAHLEGVVGLGYGYGRKQLTPTFHHVVRVDYTIDPAYQPGVVVQHGYIGGMSGGPVVDFDGQLIGVVQRSNETTGFGVDVRALRTFLLGTK